MKLNRMQRQEWAFWKRGLDYVGGEFVAPSKERMIAGLRRLGHAAKACRRKGHVWRDLDVGDPENGPNPEIVCDRCGAGEAAWEPRCLDCGGKWTCVAGSPECENAEVCPCDLSLCRTCFDKRGVK